MRPIVRQNPRLLTANGSGYAGRGRGDVGTVIDVAVKTISISMDERTYRQAKAAADRAGLPMSTWMSKSAKEKVQRDAAIMVAELDVGTGHAWATWTEASERDFAPEAGMGGVGEGGGAGKGGGPGKGGGAGRGTA
jgi:hypothetical protein